MSAVDFSGILLHVTWKATVLLAIAFALAHWFRTGRARASIWSTAMVALMLIWVFELVPSSATAAIGGTVDKLPLAAATGSMVEAAQRSLVGSLARTGPGTLFTLLIWATVAGLLTVRTSRALLRVRRVAAGSTPMRDAAWHADARRVAPRLVTRGRLELRSSIRWNVPVTWGFWRHLIILPQDAAGWSPARRRAVLVHELAHVRRHDFALQLIANLVTALHWFHPLVWIAAGRLRLEREKACDEAVLESGMDAQSYGQELLDLAAAGAPAWAPGMTSCLESRVRNLVRSSAKPTSRCAVLSLTLAVLLPGVLLACIGIDPTQTHSFTEQAGPVSRTVDADLGESMPDYEMELHARRLMLDTSGRPVGLKPTGFLQVQETVADTTHSLTARPGSGDSVDISYWVDGSERPYEGAGAEWLVSVLTQYLGPGR